MLFIDPKSSEQVLPFRLDDHHDFQDEERALRPEKGALAQTAGSFRQVYVEGPGNRSGTALSREVRPVVSFRAAGGILGRGLKPGASICDSQRP